MTTQTRAIAAAVVIVGTLLGSTAPAPASFISNYGEWSSLNFQQKTGYVMGVYDLHTAPVAGVPWIFAISDGLRTCVNATGLNSTLIIEAIDNWYKDSPSERDMPPFAAFNYAVENGVCVDYIKVEREALGLQTQ